MVDLAQLVVKLSAETAEYSAAIKRASDQIGEFGNKVQETIKHVAEAFGVGLGLHELEEFAAGIVEAADSLQKLALETGASVESLSELQGAAKITGLDDLSLSFARLSRAQAEVALGNQQMIGVFEALGISIKDVESLTPDKLLLRVADSFAKFSDGANKAAVSQILFGRGGQVLIPTLDKGSEGIKELTDQVDALGGKTTGDFARAAEEFEGDLARMKIAVSGVGQGVVADLLPALDSAIKGFTTFFKETKDDGDDLGILSLAIKGVATALLTIGNSAADVAADIEHFFHAIADRLAGYAAFVKELATDGPKAALTALSAGHEALDELDKKYQKDKINREAAYADALGKIWDTAADKQVEAAKKSGKALVLPDQNAFKGLESAIEALAKLDDKLKEQAATYGLSGAAAVAYDVTLGHLSASVDELNKKSPGEVKKALADLEKQGKLSKTAIDEITAAIAAGAPVGDAFKTAIINDAQALDRLKGIDALSKLDSQLLTMTGHLEEAAQAAFDLANRPLEITIQTTQDKTQFSGLSDVQKTAEVTAQINTLRQQAVTIEDALGKKVAEVDAAAVASGENNLKVAGDEAVARQGAIAQLEVLYVKAQALADATGLKSAIDQAEALRKAIGDIQFNSKVIEGIQAATEAEKRFTEALRVEKSINDDLSLQTAALAKQNADGALTDLDYAKKQDEARQRAIEQLQKVQQEQQQILASNPGNAQALDEYKKLGVQILNLQAQVGQLAKTIRNDLVDASSNAFADFASGTKKGSEAVHQFVSDFTRQMLQLGSRALFQKLFDVTGLTSGINSLFGGASKAAAGLGGSTAAATSISTAITTASTAGGTAMGTAVSTAATAGATELGTALEASGTAAATEMGTAIEAAGTSAATEMAAAIEAAGASSGASSAGIAALAAAAGGGPIPVNQLTLVGEEGPELFVSDQGEASAATVTESGTRIPADLAHAHVIGTHGPEFIKPNISGFVIPSDTFLRQLSDRATPRATPSSVAGESSPDARYQAAPSGPLSSVVGESSPDSEHQAVLQRGLDAVVAASAPPTPQVLGLPAGLLPVRATFESRAHSAIERPLASNVLDFPAHRLVPARAPELGAAPDRLDTEVTRAEAPERHAPLDQPISDIVVKFEQVVKHEQADLLSAHEYEALLTDRYLQKRQDGGRVSAGKPYLVGERGVPELMVPDSDGTVMNSWSDTQNSRTTVVNQTNHFLIQSANGKVDRASQGQIAARTAMAANAASSRNN